MILINESKPTDAEINNNQISIKVCSPSELMSYIHGREEGVVRFLSEGFGVDLSDQDPMDVIRDEFDHGEDRTVIFLAESGDEVVGSLYLILWRNNKSDKRGPLLNSYLQENGGELLDVETIGQEEVIASDIGILLSPKLRGKNVVKLLYDKSQEVISPPFFMGQTRNPGAVISRTRALSAYETFYGGRLVDGDDLDYTPLGSLLAGAYIGVRGDRAIRAGSDLFIHYDPEDGMLDPQINVDLGRLPPNAAETFREMILANQKRPKGYETFAPLVSVRKELVLPN